MCSPIAEATDNASVSFVTYKGDYYVSTETNFMHKVDPETLETTKKVQRAEVMLCLQSIILWRELRVIFFNLDAVHLLFSSLLLQFNFTQLIYYSVRFQIIFCPCFVLN